tara:strand:- start:469 stop:1653 length:1185 start_codon:yes stop_codon:yes gene_type:complete
MSELKVNSIKGTGASTAAITIDSSSGGCTANITNNLSNRNILINGAMQVAQRGTSSTTNGMGSVDRYYIGYNAVDEAPTQAQADISAGTTPYTLGFRKSLKITNGNQTSGAGAADYIFINMAQEAQNLATSGWNYKSSSSYVTLSFWIKSSVAQNFYFQFDVRDGTRYNYTMETGSLTANTWTKITKVIPGNSNLTIDNDNGVGAFITFGLFWGTDYTSSVSLETWGAANDSAKTPNNTSTWYTTNDSTLEFTGFQLEVGSVATDFEHRSYAQELQLCKRYYYQETRYGSTGGNGAGVFALAMTANSSNGSIYANMNHPVEMRSAPTLSFSGTFAAHRFGVSIHQITAANMVGGYHNSTTATTIAGTNSGATPGQGTLAFLEGVSGTIMFSAEL